MDWEFPFCVSMWMLCAILGGVIVNAIMVFIDAIRDRLYWIRFDREREKHRKQRR